MSDSKRKRGKVDRRMAARMQAYEVSFIARKYQVATALVRRVIRRVGNKRKAIYQMIERYKSRKRRAA